MTRRVFFAGEGPDELGNWAGHEAYHPTSDDSRTGGVLHAFVRRYLPFETVAAQSWKAIRKYKAGDHAKAEERTVMGLALRADELECDLLVFVRDRDGDRERERDVERGIERASKRFSVRIVGGTANEELEAWILAILGTPRSEALTDAKAKLTEIHGVETREQMCEIVANAKLDGLPDGCVSLERWLARFEAALATGSP